MTNNFSCLWLCESTVSIYFGTLSMIFLITPILSTTFCSFCHALTSSNLSNPRLSIHSLKTFSHILIRISTMNRRPMTFDFVRAQNYSPCRHVVCSDKHTRSRRDEQWRPAFMVVLPHYRDVGRPCVHVPIDRKLNFMPTHGLSSKTD